MLQVTSLVKEFALKAAEGRASHRAIDDVTLEVKRGELFTLLGPSGCGKTTTLRCIAGLETPTSGRISLEERALFDSSDRTLIPANQRGLGMVFQSYAIWPHMNVYENAAFPLKIGPRRSRLPEATVRERTHRVLETVGLGSFAQRPATDLSGGQQQRLALARALVMEPPLLLLDEPLSNLDAKLREEMRFELKRLQSELGVTSIYVTHDQSEALSMSDSIAVMSDGRVEQVGTPQEIYNQPKTRFVAEFIGTSNFVDGTVVSTHSGGGVVESMLGRLEVASDRALDRGADVTVSIRPESVRLRASDAAGSPTGNAFTGTVLAQAFLGEALDHLVSVAGQEIKVKGSAAQGFSPHTAVEVTLPAENCRVVDGV